jgi:GLPGLI family protein
MKKMKTLILMIAFPLTALFAQMDEGHILYDLKMESSDPEVEAQLSMVAGSTMEIFFKEENVRLEMSIGTFQKTTTITNMEEGKTVSLIDGMMGKYATVIEIKEDEAEVTEEEGEIEIELVEGETKEVAGYTCKKAIIIDEDGNESVFWYTEEIKTLKNGGAMINNQIPGMPLEFSVVNPQITMVMTAREVNNKLKKSKQLFSTDIPEGYDVKELDELQDAMGQ